MSEAGGDGPREAEATPVERPLRVLDLVVLVGALAVGSTAHRYHGWPLSVGKVGGFHPAMWRAVYWAALPPLWFASSAMVLLRLWPPRPPFRQLVVQPGMSACFVGFLLGAILLLVAVILQAMGRTSLVFEIWAKWPSTAAPSITGHGHVVDAFWPALFARHADAPGVAVLAAWLTLGLGGMWRWRGSALEWAGRVVGLCWLLVTGFSWSYWIQM